MVKHLLLFVVFLSCHLSVAGDKQASEQAALRLISKASSMTDIFSTGPFRMTVRLKMQVGNYLHEGEYQLFWVSETKWRDQLALSNYREIRVGVGDQVSAYRNLPQYAYLSMLFRERLFGTGGVNLNRGWKVRRMTQKRFAGKQQMSCIDLKGDSEKTLEECFHPETEAYLGSSDDMFLSDFQSFQGKLFPRRWQTKDGEIDAQVVELVEVPSFEDSTFNPLKTEPRVGCFNPRPPIWTNRIEPRVPDISSMISSQVQMSAVVGRDGLLSEPVIVNHPKEAFAAEAVVAARKWRFKPAECDGKPVQADIFISVYLSSFGKEVSLIF